MKSTIPIFPLSIVIFPGSKYPLHIFEERYKKLMQRCIETGEGFGIVSKKDLEISTIGCYVKLYKILKKYDNGSMDIIIEGIERFQSVATALHKDNYLEAEILPYYDEESPNFNAPNYSKTIEKFRNVLNKTSIVLENKFWDNLDVSNLKSFKIAEKAGLNLQQQQVLLQLKSESERLKFIYKHLENLENYFEETEVVKEIISGDGYLNE
jgi:ATP-dependent Lon protease